MRQTIPHFSCTFMPELFCWIPRILFNDFLLVNYLSVTFLKSLGTK